MERQRESCLIWIGAMLSRIVGVRGRRTLIQLGEAGCFSRRRRGLFTCTVVHRLVQTNVDRRGIEAPIGLVCLRVARRVRDSCDLLLMVLVVSMMFSCVGVSLRMLLPLVVRTRVVFVHAAHDDENQYHGEQGTYTEDDAASDGRRRLGGDKT